ncbi:serin endopeptidase [Coniochaeta ligniaria NRRL 30616]|uniref:Serin endopeptidase n=1 Tax=Coniochaeta ligniaria NRRL 30616 TaxID=1408157 RepID=A0A1J7J256_9PEZI|nr:serin endopeptidase [Coniochaeta ligniaria NRRL 30616]
MRVTYLLSALSAGGTVLAVTTGISSKTPLTSTNSTVIPKQFIIEVAEGSSLADLTAKLEALSGTTITKVYDTAIFSGVSVVSTDSNVDSLKSIDAAATVWPSRRITVKDLSAVNASTALTKRDLSPAQTFAAAAASPNYSVHGMTGVDKLHAAGIYGNGAQIALIDTGVQYTHAALGGCFGPGCKVAGGYDLVGNGCWPILGCSKAPDSDPYNTAALGTALAGVIVGTESTNNYKGVAPEATLYSYKVVTAQGETDEDTLIEAFLMAYEDGADVISSNIGTLGGFSDDPLSVVASRMVDQGVVVTVATGDYGTEGPFFGNAGGSGSKVLAVAAVEASNDAEPVFIATFNIDGESAKATIGNQYLYTPMPWTRDGWPIIPLTMNTNVTDDACEALPATAPNYTEALALVRLGGCTPRVKQANLIAAGAQNIIFYWDPADIGVDPFVSRLSSFVITITDTAGEAIVNTYLAGGNVTANFDADTIYSAGRWVGMPDEYAGQPLDDNSMGPLYDLSIKPDVAAPGGYVFSTYPTDDWAVLTGTELASAYVAGIAALYIGQYGGRKTNSAFNATDLTMRIISSGSAVPHIDYRSGDLTGFNSPVTQVGTGLVNAFKVLNYTTQLSYSKFALNDTHYFERYQKVDITNNADVDVTYTFAAIPAAGYEAWSVADASIKTEFDLVDVEIDPTISLPSALKIKAGNTKTAQVNFGAPAYANDNLPVYSGLIQVNSTLGESFSIPYLGLAAKLSGFFTSQFPRGYPYIVSGLDDVLSTTDSTWSFDLAVNKQDFPKLFLRTVFGSEEVRWDIFQSGWVEKNWAYPPVVGQKSFVGSATYWSYSGDALMYDPADSNVANSTIAFPDIAVERFTDDFSDSQFWWLGPLANGTMIAPGKYVMRVAALLPFGDRTRSAGWSTFTQSFTVV